MDIPDHEVGATICRCGPNYELGPMASGTRNRVKVPISCRTRCKPVGIVHTHPGGPVRLSNVDKKSLAKAKLSIGCVTDGVRMRCFRVKASKK